MKIKELQAGGLLTYAPSNIPQLQIPRGNGSAPASEEQASGDDSLLSKDVVKQLLENGLSNDVDAYLQQISKYGNIMSIDPKQANQMMLNQYSYVNKIIQNKANLEDSIKRADKNNGLNELAITTTGQILVENVETGRIDQVSASELKDNRDILRPLTNSELVMRRQTDPSLSFNTSIASVVGNGVGPDKVTDYILGVASKIGQSKLTSEGYINKKEQNIAEGIQKLLQGGEDGIYKISSTQTDQSQQVNQALKYIYSVLPQNMKNFLRATSAAGGIDPEKGAFKLIQDMITSTVNITDETKVDYDSTQSKELNERVNGKTGSGGSEDKEGIAISQSLMITSGKGVPSSYQLNTGTNYTISVDGEYFQTPTTKKDNEPIAKSMTLASLLTDTSIAGTVNPGSVYIGSQKLTESDFSKVVYDNSGGFMTTFLPYKKDSSGNKVPDFGALEELSKVKDEIKNKGTISDIEKRKIYEQHNLSEYYIMSEVDPQAINYNVIAPFLIFNGITSNDSEYGVSGIDTKDKYLSVNDSRYKGVQTSTFENVMSESLSTSGKPKSVSISNIYNSIGIGGDDIISGTVYIPLSEDKLSVYSVNKAFKIPKLHGFADYLMRNDAIRRKKESLNITTLNNLGD